MRPSFAGGFLGALIRHVSVLGVYLDSVQLRAVESDHHEVHMVGSEGLYYAGERFHVVPYFFLRARVSLHISTCTPSTMRL